jgi:hypothetical protein
MQCNKEQLGEFCSFFFLAIFAQQHFWQETDAGLEVRQGMVPLE